MSFIRDFVTYEKYLQIASLVSETSLFTVTHILFFISPMRCQWRYCSLAPSHRCAAASHWQLNPCVRNDFVLCKTSPCFCWRWNLSTSIFSQQTRSCGISIFHERMWKLKSYCSRVSYGVDKVDERDILTISPLLAISARNIVKSSKKLA